MRNSLLLFSAIIAVSGLLAAPALAGGCSGSATVATNTGFVVPEIAFTATKEPVSQDVLSLTCGELTYSLIPTTELSSKGTYGDRGYGDEIDGSVTYDHSLKATPIGPVDLELGGIYQKFAPFKSADGTLVLYADFARPFQLSDVVKVSPFIRITKWVGTGSIPGDAFIRPGLRVNANLAAKLMLSLEVSRAIHFEESNPERGITYGNLALTRDFGHGLSLGVTAQVVDHAPAVFGLELIKNW